MIRAYGKVFVNDKGEEFGLIRDAEPPFPIELSNQNVIAEDESGNYFLEVGGEVIFWDHETNEQIGLSSSLQEFISGCVAPSEVEFEPGQVESVWIDPEFAKKLGVEPKP